MSDTWPCSTSSLLEHVPALDDSGDSFLNTLLYDYDFSNTANTLGTGLFDLNSMTTGPASTTMGGQYCGDALFNWEQPDVSHMPTPMLSIGSDIRTTTSSPTHMISPVSSHSSSSHVDAHSFHPTNAKPPSASSLSNKRPAPKYSEAASTPSSTLDDNDRVTKRHRNTEAARRYRQRKLDRVTELEEALAEMTKERDELKLKLARSEAEADVLRSIRKG